MQTGWQTAHKETASLSASHLLAPLTDVCFTYIRQIKLLRKQKPRKAAFDAL